MPVTSKAQWRYMGHVMSEGGEGGLSATKAREFLHKSKGTYHELPSRKAHRVLGKIKRAKKSRDKC